MIGVILALSFQHTLPENTATVATPEGDLEVEVAESPAEQREGLMNRSEVPLDGLLFVYDQPSELVFWMKDTSIPLDIVFLDRNCTVLNVESADPEPGVPPEDLEKYRSSGLALYALEIPQGKARELGLEPGVETEVEIDQGLI